VSDAPTSGRGPGGSQPRWLFWHRRDLRLADNLGLAAAAAATPAVTGVFVLDQAKAETPKTAALAGRLKALGWSSVLVIAGEVDDNFALASRNMPFVDVLPQIGANVYDILRRDTLVLTRDAVEALEARLK